MWTYLRLLSIEESLGQFLETEGRERVPDLLKEAEAEAGRLNGEVESLKAKGNTALLETKQRFLARASSGSMCCASASNAANKPAPTSSGDGRTGPPGPANQTPPRRCHRHKNAETLTARIDATVEHLDQLRA